MRRNILYGNGLPIFVCDVIVQFFVHVINEFVSIGLRECFFQSHAIRISDNEGEDVITKKDLMNVVHNNQQ